MVKLRRIETKDGEVYFENSKTGERVITGMEVSKTNGQIEESGNKGTTEKKKPIKKNKIAIWVGFTCGILWTLLSIGSKGKIPGGAQGGVAGFIIGYLLAWLVLVFIPSPKSGSKIYTCNSCNREISDEDKVCPHCGADLADVYECENCKAEVSAEDKTCPKCGNDLE